jgi:hypothetical protein
MKYSKGALEGSTLERRTPCYVHTLIPDRLVSFECFRRLCIGVKNLLACITLMPDRLVSFGTV